MLLLEGHPARFVSSSPLLHIRLLIVLIPLVSHWRKIWSADAFEAFLEVVLAAALAANPV